MISETGTNSVTDSVNSKDNLTADALSYIIKTISQNEDRVLLVVADDSLSALKLEQNLKFFLHHQIETGYFPVLSFPDWETLPYDRFSPHQDIISERLTTLYQLPTLKRGVLVVPAATLMHRLCPKSYVMQNTLLLKVDDNIDLSRMRCRLEESGYHCVSEVMEHGEFAVRGSIIDLFPMGSAVPYRIDLFDNVIDSIRSFDVDSQRTLEKLDEIRLLPAREFPLTKEAISHFRTAWREEFEGDPRQCTVYLDVSEGHVPQGIEYYLALFFEQTSNLLEYLAENSLIIKCKGVNEAIESFWQQAKERYDQYGHDRLRPILAPKQLFLPPQEMFGALKQFSQYNFHYPYLITALPNLSIEPRHAIPLLALKSYLEDHGFLGNFENSDSLGGLDNLDNHEIPSSPKNRILFTAESLGRCEVFKELLLTIDCKALEISGWDAFVNSDIPLAITTASLEQGFTVDDITVIPEAVVLGRRVLQTRRRNPKHKAFEVDFEVRSLAEITVGAPVVHIDYGIGRYLGLTHLTLSGQEGEFVTLEYAGGDKLYVPVTSLHLISRYSGVDLEHAPLHRLGTDHWQKIKHKVLEQTRDVAAELLEIYAKREAKLGYAFTKPEQEYVSFAAEFPFEETPDQQRAIVDVLKDLTSAKPMDRVVCGDVGFGKTEVAMRAAFVAASNGKQVAILVPTTLLAQQHFQTFSDRFANFPIKVDMLSRFRTKKEQESIIERVKAGSIDILIGTHKILQDDIQFKSLGLIIIDEEHRFGVRQKETFKALRAEVDILTMTATPIPRTLNMAMSHMRDLSIIATPPAKRLSIKTFVREKEPALIQEAILRELHRGGQVYYLYNEVETIENRTRELENLLPEARIHFAHGQMRERELEQVMSDFYHHRFNVLVCTTIIETGIDIPTANTIIIERADKLGLAQLHQLRGRVGRSHHQAYAFCLTPTTKSMTKDALKRLEALESLEELGAGFTLATHDLEIRGAGELLGEEQSGNIQSVGFPLFMELLDQAVKLLKEGKTINFDAPLKKHVEIDLQLPAIIPEGYLSDVHSRLVLYKRIASARSETALKDLQSEMIDRFGLLPLQTQFLFKMTELRLLAESLGILKIDAGPLGGKIEFSDKPKIDPDKIIQLIQTKPQIYRLEGPTKLRFKQDLADREARIKTVLELISFLRGRSSRDIL